MRRYLLALLTLTLLASGACADTFDHYINPVLARAVEAETTQEVKELTTRLLVENDRVLAGTTSSFLIVKTNAGRYAKLLVQPAKQKVSDEKSLPILLIDRYVTYREGEERTVTTSGTNVSLFPGFRFSLDLGQVVPEELGGDLRFVVEDGKVYTQPLGKAKLYLVTKALPDVAAKKPEKLVVGAKFEPRYFNGTFQLYDDGRRSGRLTLQVDDDGAVRGAYYSDKDGQKYEVRGKIGTPKHSIQFTIQLPRSEQTFQGWLFTGDGKALTGSSRLAEHEAGFYAVRVEE
jgi:hypothetical protein